ncbi:EKC/KEOPS complex subunit BUD32 [Abortiporus biennis]
MDRNVLQPIISTSDSSCSVTEILGGCKSVRQLYSVHDLTQIRAYNQYREKINAATSDLRKVFISTVKKCAYGTVAVPCIDEDCTFCSLLCGQHDTKLGAFPSYRPLGPGLYFQTSVKAAIDCHTNRYGLPPNTIIIFEVAIGKASRTHKANPQLTQPPKGFHSICALPGIDFKHEEIIVYNSDAVCPINVIILDEPNSSGFLAKPTINVSIISATPGDTDNSIITSSSILKQSSTISPIVQPELSYPAPNEDSGDRRRENRTPLSNDDSSMIYDSPTEEYLHTGPISDYTMSFDSPVADNTTSIITSDQHLLPATPSESNACTDFEWDILPLPKPVAITDRFIGKEVCILHNPNGSPKENPLTCNRDCLAITRFINKIRTFCSKDKLPTLSHRVLRALQSDANRNEIISLKGEAALEFLDDLQEILDTEYIWTEQPLLVPIRTRLSNIVLQLAISSGQLPTHIFVTDVQNLETESKGNGGFADIWSAKLQGRDVALKKVRFVAGIRDSERRELERSFYHEALLWKNLMHRHVLPFYGIDRTTFKGHLSMVLPWMEHQNIIHTIDIVRRQWGFTKEKFYFRVIRWLQEIAQGLAYLHDQGIVHADLRGLNILIDSDYSVRLADFGLAAFASKIGPWDSIRGGNSRWMAPELLIAEREDRDWRPTPESDMYSFGCVIVELFTLEAPFRNSHPLDHQIRMVLSFKLIYGSLRRNVGFKNPRKELTLIKL